MNEIDCSIKSINLTTPITDEQVNQLKVGDMLSISGMIYTGRDAVLPKLVQLFKSGIVEKSGIQLKGSVIFHTAVSPAGIGPTSSNKLDIEGSIPILSEAGVKIHIGKGELNEETVKSLHSYNSIYALTPPITALLSSRIKSKSVVAFPEEGMEAMHVLEVENFPAIIAAIHGITIQSERPNGSNDGK